VFRRLAGKGKKSGEDCIIKVSEEGGGRAGGCRKVPQEDRNIFRYLVSRKEEMTGGGCVCLK